MASLKTTEASARAKKLTPEDKRKLRASLNQCLVEADSNPDAGLHALRLSVILRVKIPARLKCRKNIAQAFSLDEIVRSLERLGTSQFALDLSQPLFALRDSLLITQPKPALVASIVKRANARICGYRNNKSNEADTLINHKPKAQFIFTGRTLEAALDWTLHALPRLFELPVRSSPRAYKLTLDMVQGVEIIWRQFNGPIRVHQLFLFIRSLPRVVPSSMYSQLIHEKSFIEFMREIDTWMNQEAENALLEARLKDLETIISLRLQSICQSRSSDLLPETIEWVTRQMDGSNTLRNVPKAVDHGQSSELNYVALSLLAAWEAAQESSTGRRALETSERMAKDLFNVKLTGNKGEIVPYNASHHRLSNQDESASELVRIVRPGVHWIDGPRTRSLIPALVEYYNQP
jgi:hypothetical protein